ncbi:MAG: hypothetical protein ACLP50_18560, partial [Solirubrobacteraceae bacterium]
DGYIDDDVAQEDLAGQDELGEQALAEVPDASMLVSLRRRWIADARREGRLDDARALEADEPDLPPVECDDAKRNLPWRQR